MADIPTTTSRYTIDFAKGFDGLQIQHDVPIRDLGDSECLIRIKAVSLNYRDIAMPLGIYPGVSKSGLVPTSDSAGTVVKVGSAVTGFKEGDKVCNTFFLDWEDGPITPEVRKTSLGALNDGPLSRYVVFPAKSLVHAPKHLNERQASTLPCAALTAWSALFGLEGCKLQAGQCVLTQGTGGVSLFAAQFALATGATVIATTSSDDKAEKLKALGVQHVINYRTDADWGQTAKELSPDGRGVQHVIEVGGNATLSQSFKAVALMGSIDIIGFLAPAGPDTEQPSFWDTFNTCSIVRGINVGSRRQFGDMVKFMEEHKIVPVVDEARFDFEHAVDAYKHLQAQKFFGKVVIDVN